MKAFSQIHCRGLSLGLVIFFGLAAPMQAVIWDGEGPTSNWLDGLNWGGNQVPAAPATATILNDTATITGVVVPPIQALDVGFGDTPGGLEINGAGATAMLEVFNQAVVATGGQLDVGFPNANLLAGNFFNEGGVTVSTGGQITSSGPYIQSGGDTILSGGQISTPALQIADGTLQGTGQVFGNVFVGGFPTSATPLLSPGVGMGIGDLAIDGDLGLRSNAEYLVEIDASGPKVVADLVNVSGTATLDGTLQLDLVAGSIPTGERVDIVLADNIQIGASFNIMGAETESGWLFVTLDPTGSPSGGPVMNLYGTIEEGDMNGDGNVNGLDAKLFGEVIADAGKYTSEFYDPLVIVPGDCGGKNKTCTAGPASTADMDHDKFWTFVDVQMFLRKIEDSGGNAEEVRSQIASVLNRESLPEPSAIPLVVVASCILAGAQVRPRRPGFQKQHCARPIRLQHRPQCGFTLVDLLVVVAIISVLIAMLFPAVQSAREASRRTKCLNNLKQQATALLNYHAQQGRFPEGARRHQRLGTVGVSWHVLVLPMLEQSALYDEIRPLPDGGARALIPRKIPVVFICPSADQPSNDPDAFQSSNYVGVAGSGLSSAGSDSTRGPVFTDGILYFDSEVDVIDISDGSASTLLVGERTFFDPHKFWSWGAAWSAGSAEKPAKIDVGAAKNVVWPINTIENGRAAWKRDTAAPAELPDILNNDLPFGSQHPGGAGFAFADGSVHFLEETLDLTIFQELASRNGGETNRWQP